MGSIVERIFWGIVEAVDYLVWRVGNAMRRDQRVEFAVYAVAILIILLMFGFAGSMDYADEQREIAYWAERGIEIARW